MAQLWDKAGFFGHLRGILHESAFDVRDHQGALRLVNAALHQGRLEFGAGRHDRAAQHFSLAVAIFVEKNAIEMPAAIDAVHMLAKCFHRRGQLSYAFTAHVLLAELAPAAASDVEATKREHLRRMAEIAGEAERGHIARFDDAAVLREEALDLLMAGSLRDGDNFLGLKYGYELLKHQVRTRGEHHVDVAGTAANLSTACLNLGLYRSGARFARQALSILKGDPEACAGAYALANFNLGLVLAREGRVDEARACLQRALEVAESEYGPGDSCTRRVRKAINDLGRSRRSASVVPGQPGEVVRRPDGSTSISYSGLPDNDDFEEVIRLGEALWDSGVLSIRRPTAQAPVPEGTPSSRYLAKRVPEFPLFRDGGDATSCEPSRDPPKAGQDIACKPEGARAPAGGSRPRSDPK